MKKNNSIYEKLHISENKLLLTTNYFRFFLRDILFVMNLARKLIYPVLLASDSMEKQS